MTSVQNYSQIVASFKFLPMGGRVARALSYLNSIHESIVRIPAIQCLVRVFHKNVFIHEARKKLKTQYYCSIRKETRKYYGSRKNIIKCSISQDKISDGIKPVYSKIIDNTRKRISKEYYFWEVVMVVKPNFMTDVSFWSAPKSIWSQPE